MEGSRKRKGMPHGNHNEYQQVKQWKENGPEQRELEKLFQLNIIDAVDTPKNIRMKYPLFSQFSNTVFANHFRKTKAKFSKFCEFYIYNKIKL